MEREGYAVGSAVLGAHSVGSFHQRQRMYWVANTSSKGLQKQPGVRGFSQSKIEGNQGKGRAGSGCVHRMADTADIRRESQPDIDATGILRASDEQAEQIADVGAICSTFGGMGNTEHNGLITSQIAGSNAASILHGETRTDSTGESTRASAFRSIPDWLNPDWIYCRDNKYRPIKPGLKPLVRTAKPGAIEMVNGLSGGVVRGVDNGESVNAEETTEARVMRLKGYGNAIVPQLAAEFIKAFFGNS